MKLEIRQDQHDPLDGYRVYSQGRLLLRAQRSIRGSVRQETILRSSDGKEVLRIDPRFFIHRPSYDIRSGSELLAFRTQSWLKSVYSLTGGATQYSIFGHRSAKPKCSVHLAGVQVAAILRRPFSLLESDLFSIVYVEPAHDHLLVAIALILDRMGGSANDALATYHGPAAWLEARRFDESWLDRHQEPNGREHG